MVCTKGRAQEYINSLPELACGGHFRPRKTAEKALTEWVLLVHFVQEFLQLLQVMRELPKDRENDKERHDAKVEIFDA